MKAAVSPEAPSTQIARRRWPRWMGVALVASLGLNLLIVGALAAAALRHRFSPPPHIRQATVLDFTRTLPGERRRALFEATNAERMTIRPFRAEIRRARAESRAALQAEPFDAERFKAAQEHVLAAETRARTAAQALIHAIVVKMSPQERAELAKWQHAAERPWRRRGPAPGETSDDADTSTPPRAPSPPPASKP